MIEEEEGYRGIWLKPVDARRYAWTRVAFAAAALCQLIHLWPYRNGLLGAGGLIPEEAARSFNPGFHLPSLLVIDPPWWPSLIIGAGILAAILLLWGKWARASLAVVFLVLVVTVQRAPLASTGWDFVLTNFGFILLFSPLGADWTPRRLWRSRRKAPLGRWEAGMLPRYGLVLLQIQVAVIYWQAVFERMGDRFWRNGEFLSYYLLSHHSRFAGPWVLEWEGWLKTATYLTNLIEIAIPILLWIPVTRKAGVLTGAVLHLGIAAVSLDIGLFTIAMLMAYVPFLGGLPTEDWDD